MNKIFENLINWSELNYSSLPWRHPNTRTLYTTLVSEIMLQQTTVGTVLNHFEKFLNKFPNIESLAVVSEEDLLVAWKGLGYYRRALSLKKIAKQIMEIHQGVIPQNYDELIKLNGIGPYTANAIQAIGLDKKALAIDANLERVLTRFYQLKIEEVVENFNQGLIFGNVDQLSFRKLNEALMDLGRSVCKRQSANCEMCLLKDECRSKGKIEKPKAKLKKMYELNLLRVLCLHENKVLVYQKNENEWLSGQWELPTFQMLTELSDQNLLQYPKTAKNLINKLPKIKTNITKYKINNWILKIDLADQNKLSLFSSQLENRLEWKILDVYSNLTTASQKIIDYQNTHRLQSFLFS